MSSRPPRELTRDQRAAIRKQVTKCCANYDNQDQLCLPLDCPCYMLQKWWTGSYCRYFREAVLPADPALESAITGEDTSMRQKTCPVCGSRYLKHFGIGTEQVEEAAAALFPEAVLDRLDLCAGYLPGGSMSGNESGGNAGISSDMSAS